MNYSIAMLNCTHMMFVVHGMELIKFGCAESCMILDRTNSSPEYVKEQGPCQMFKSCISLYCTYLLANLLGGRLATAEWWTCGDWSRRDEDDDEIPLSGY